MTSTGCRVMGGDISPQTTLQQLGRLRSNSLCGFGTIIFDLSTSQWWDASPRAHMASRSVSPTPASSFLRVRSFIANEGVLLVYVYESVCV